jgi:phage gp36-like protein
MMAYSAQDDILDQLDEAILIQLTDDEGTGSVNADRVAQAIADADAEIDGYLASRHQVPLDPVPENIRKYSVDIAIYNLFSRRADTLPDTRKERYQAAVRYLEKVAEGKWTLGANDPDGNPSSSDRPQMSPENPERLFTRDTMKGF